MVARGSTGLDRRKRAAATRLLVAARMDARRQQVAEIAGAVSVELAQARLCRQRAADGVRSLVDELCQSVPDVAAYLDCRVAEVNGLLREARARHADEGESDGDDTSGGEGSRQAAAPSPAPEQGTAWPRVGDGL